MCVIFAQISRFQGIISESIMPTFSRCQLCTLFGLQEVTAVRFEDTEGLQVAVGTSGGQVGVCCATV